MSPNPTNYSKSTPNASNYNLTAATSTDILLLESGSKLLLENGVDNLLIESGKGVSQTDYTKISPNATNYT